MNTQVLRCAICGFETESIEEMDIHLSQKQHSLDTTGDKGKTTGGKTISEATGIDDEQLGAGRGLSDPVTGVKDYADDAEANSDDTVP